MRSALGIVMMVLSILSARPADAQEMKQTEKQEAPVPAFSGRVRIIIFADIVTEAERTPKEKGTPQVTLDEIKAALSGLRGVSDVKHEPGSREISVQLEGKISDAEKIRLALKRSKIDSAILSPARIVLRPKVRIRNMEVLIALFKKVPGVAAAGEGRNWGVPDPTVGVLSFGALMDVRPTVGPQRKYVWLNMDTTKASLTAIQTIWVNTAVAFADFDKTSPEALRQLVEKCGVKCRIMSHRVMKFTFSEAGAVEEAKRELSRLKGVMIVEIDEQEKIVTVTGVKGLLSGFKIRDTLRRLKFKRVATKR